MWNEWGDTTDNTFWSWSPLGDTEIDTKMEDKGEYHDEKNLECPYLISSITQISSAKPEIEEK
jgi:hypothetical protein